MHFALCVMQRSIEYKMVISVIGIERTLARLCAIVAEKCRKSSSNGEDIRRSTQNTSVSLAWNICLFESIPSYPATISSILFPGWMQTPQILKETVSQSVSPSEESSCSFPIGISLPLFTRDKESIETRINEENPAGGRRGAVEKTSLHEL